MYIFDGEGLFCGYGKCEGGVNNLFVVFIMGIVDMDYGLVFYIYNLV